MVVFRRETCGTGVVDFAKEHVVVHSALQLQLRPQNSIARMTEPLTIVSNFAIPNANDNTAARTSRRHVHHDRVGCRSTGASIREWQFNRRVVSIGISQLLMCIEIGFGFRGTFIGDNSQNRLLLGQTLAAVEHFHCSEHFAGQHCFRNKSQIGFELRKWFLCSLLKKLANAIGAPQARESRPGLRLPEHDLMGPMSDNGPARVVPENRGGASDSENVGGNDT